MAKFLLNNAFHNSASTTAKGILLTGHLIPATASILPGAWLVFANGKLEVVEVRLGGARLRQHRLSEHYPTRVFLRHGQHQNRRGGRRAEYI